MQSRALDSIFVDQGAAYKHDVMCKVGVGGWSCATQLGRAQHGQLS